MTCISTDSLRLGFLTLVATMVTVGVCGEALAKTYKARLHARRPISDSRAQLLPQPPFRLGAIRYYGGPKSPMWRGPVEN